MHLATRLKRIEESLDLTIPQPYQPIFGSRCIFGQLLAPTSKQGSHACTEAGKLMLCVLNRSDSKRLCTKCFPLSTIPPECSDDAPIPFRYQTMCYYLFNKSEAGVSYHNLLILQVVGEAGGDECSVAKGKCARRSRMRVALDISVSREARGSSSNKSSSDLLVSSVTGSQSCADLRVFLPSPDSYSPRSLW